MMLIKKVGDKKRTHKTHEKSPKICIINHQHRIHICVPFFSSIKDHHSGFLFKLNNFYLYDKNDRIFRREILSTSPLGHGSPVTSNDTISEPPETSGLSVIKANYSRVYS